MAYEYKTILVEIKPPLGKITLNQPEKRNPLSYPRLNEIRDCAKEMERDDDVNVIIIKGAGPCFSAGYDLTQGRGGQGTLRPESGVYIHPDRDGLWGSYNLHHMEVYFSLWDLQKPVVAQIHKWCLAGATELASFCDLRILSDDALIGFPVAHTLSPGNIQYMPWMVGITKAKEYMMTGEPMDAQEAFRVGWATRVSPRETLEEDTEKVALSIANAPTDLIMFTKRSINRQFELMGFRNGLMWGSDYLTLQGRRKSAGEFSRIAAEKGLKAALAWRDAGRGLYAFGARGTKTKES